MELAVGTSDVLTNPSIVVEVLSPSTETYDRGVEWDGYQGVASITDYLLVSQSKARIEQLRRAANGTWEYRAFEAGDSVVLTNGASVDVAAVFAGVFELEGN
jgi:Uma2 family endonuclease